MATYDQFIGLAAVVLASSPMLAWAAWLWRPHYPLEQDHEPVCVPATKDD